MEQAPDAGATPISEYEIVYTSASGNSSARFTRTEVHLGGLDSATRYSIQASERASEKHESAERKSRAREKGEGAERESRAREQSESNTSGSCHHRPSYRHHHPPLLPPPLPAPPSPRFSSTRPHPPGARAKPLWLGSAEPSALARDGSRDERLDGASRAITQELWHRIRGLCTGAPRGVSHGGSVSH